MNKPSEFFGEVNKRARWQAQYLKSLAFGEEPSVRWLHQFLVDGKDVAIWWTQKELEVKTGEMVWVVGTVKEHKIYRDTRQTVLTRCQVYDQFDLGTCPTCEARLLPADIGRRCQCKAKVCRTWFPGLVQGPTSDLSDVPF